MIAIATVVVVVLLSLIVTRVATVILTLTGLSRESARFQARSAFSGVGFTTSEAEAMLRHPVRRRVVMTLMLVGSAGIVTVIASVVLGLSGEGGSTRLNRIAILVVALFVVFLASRTRVFDRSLTRLIRRVLVRYTDLDARDYASLLELAGPYAVAEIAVDEDSWLARRSLAELDLRSEGIAALGIRRPDGTYIGVPTGETVIEVGDVLLVYSDAENLEAINRRAADVRGDFEHDEGVRRKRRVVLEEGESDPVSADEPDAGEPPDDS